MCVAVIASDLSGGWLVREQQTFQASAANALDMMREQQAFYDGGGTTAESFRPAGTGKD